MQQRSSRRRVTRRPRYRRPLGYGLLVVVVLVLSCMYVWQRVYSLRLAEERALRLQRVRALEENCRALEYDIAELSAMQRIESIAVDGFGMSPLKESQVISYPGYRDQDSRRQDQIAEQVVRGELTFRKAAAMPEGE
jgi:cell division protein FtsL